MEYKRGTGMKARNTGNCDLFLLPATAELIPEPTARLVEKSIADNTMRNRKQASAGILTILVERATLFEIGQTGHLAEYATHLFDHRQSSRNNQHCRLRSEVATETPQ